MAAHYFSARNFNTSNVTSSFMMNDGGLRPPDLRAKHSPSIAEYFEVVPPVMGIILNVLTIVIISLGKYTSKEVHIQLINLSIADILASAMSIIRRIVFDLHTLHSRPARIVYHSFLEFSELVSPFFNAVISVERFMVICMPLRVAHYRKRQKLLLIAIMWTCLVMITTASACVDVYFQCEHLCRTAIQSSVGILILIIISVSYSLIAVKLCRRKSIGENVNSNQESRMRKQTVQVVRMLGIDAFITILTWLPYNIHNLYKEINFQPNPKSRPPIEIMSSLYFIALTNCFTTAVLYYALNERFRKDTHLLFRRCFPKKHHQTESKTGLHQRQLERKT